MRMNSKSKRLVVHFCDVGGHVSSYRRETATLWNKPTRRLEVESPKLDGIGGMVERHLFVVGKAAFPGLRLCPFSTQQGTSCD